MLKYLLLLNAWFFLNSCGQAQTGSDDLVKQAGIKLKEKSLDVSELLSDKTYLPAHPLTSFRDLVRQYATTDVLKITSSGEPGTKIRVLCTITDIKGKPVPDALVYLYQTDSKGWYAADAPHILQNSGDMEHARLFGYVKTDASGNFELQTVKPSGYPQSDLPAHIHIHITKPGYRSYVSEFLFDDDPRLKGDIRANSIQNRFMISKPEKADIPFEQQFSYIITLTN